MSVDKRKNTIWDVELERSREQFAAELTAFEQHKKHLLDILRKVHEDAAKSEPFINEDNSWRALTYAAMRYFQQLKIKPKKMLPARRVERLRDLANALGRARHEADKAMKDDVGRYLFEAWVFETKLPRASEVALDDRDAVEAFLTRRADDLKKAVASLATLETVARKAARDVSTKRGPQRGSGILPLENVLELAGVYLWSTGRKPIMSAGPFAQFVEAFLTAMGRGDETANDYVVEALKYARKQARKIYGSPSPFDE